MPVFAMKQFGRHGFAASAKRPVFSLVGEPSGAKCRGSNGKVKHVASRWLQATDLFWKHTKDLQDCPLLGCLRCRDVFSFAQACTHLPSAKALEPAWALGAFQKHQKHPNWTQTGQHRGRLCLHCGFLRWGTASQCSATSLTEFGLQNLQLCQLYLKVAESSGLAWHCKYVQC